MSVEKAVLLLPLLSTWFTISMDSTSTAAWAGPYELELAKNWTAEDDAQVWAPAVGHPYLQYGSIANIFGPSCSRQPYVVPASSDSSGGQQQLVDYNYYAAAAQHHDPDPMETYRNNPEKLFQERKEESEDDAQMIERKMHRYPPSIQALGDWYTEPKFVAIGPYYHGQDRLQMAEKKKHVAALYCIRESKSVNGLSVQDMYDAVVSVAAKIDARGLYDKDVMAGFGYENDFLPIMFYDACFLVTYMLARSHSSLDTDLVYFFQSNDNEIAPDIMLLENQIPLQVVDAVMKMCTAEPLERMKEFIHAWRKDGFLQDRWDVSEEGPRVDSDEFEYYYNEAPHLLGLLRFYAVGKRRIRKHEMASSDILKIESLSISASAIELGEMGISLTANKTMVLADMGLAKKWIILKKLFMAPLSLNDTRARWLVSMAALELCTTPNFFDIEGEFEDSAICSYLLLLCMLIHRMEDVHELRTRGILQGAGLSNEDTLKFFTSLQSLRKGRCYTLVMCEIQDYRNKRPRWIKVCAFLYNNWKYFTAVVSVIGGFIGIITALMKLKGSLGH